MLFNCGGSAEKAFACVDADGAASNIIPASAHPSVVLNYRGTQRALCGLTAPCRRGRALHAPTPTAPSSWARAMLSWQPYRAHHDEEQALVDKVSRLNLHRQWIGPGTDHRTI